MLVERVTPRAHQPWAHYLAASLPLVFVLGVTAILGTRYIDRIYHPEQWVDSVPSISGTASEPPGSAFFLAMILPVTLCILVTWALNLMMNRQRLAALAPSPLRFRLTALNLAACGMGMLAGIFLALIGIINLSDGHDLHILFSKLFFITQVEAYLLDSWSALWLRRACPGLDGPVERAARNGKFFMSATCLMVALLFLFMYLVRDYAPPAWEYPLQEIYVANEYTLALLCFAYPFTCYGEIKRHFRAIDV